MHLVLLVGKNPLQAYITARYYAEVNNDPPLHGIWLVHSEPGVGGNSGTLQYAKSIETMLILHNPSLSNRIWLVPLSDIENGAEIEHSIGKKLPKEITKEGIHLDYTGGTKTMGVHIFRALEKMTTDPSKFEYSYLSARDFQIHSFDRSNQPKGLSGDLRDTIHLSLNDLLELHLYEAVNELNRKQLFSSVLQTLDQAIQEGEIGIFLNWCEKDLHRLFPTQNHRENVNTWMDALTDEYKGSFQESLRKFPLVMDILSKLPKESSILNEKGELWIPQEGEVSNPEFKKRVKESWGFLNGKWLERYIYSSLCDMKLEEIDVYADFKVRKSGHIVDAKDFEMDGLIIRGYQVFGVSITTSTKSDICKSKGFEILHRSAEIGGDESKGILITGLSQENVRKTQEDLNAITNQKKGKLLVLGLEDWKHEGLTRKITEFILE